jgi:nicotinamide phosphoribosyltransferase
MDDKNYELNYIRTMLEFFKEYDIVAMVGDSYNIYHFCNLLGEMKEEILEETQNGKKTLVVRPDSGDPSTVPVEVIKILAEKFGFTINSKGFKVLPPYIRVIQGDGINEHSLPKIIDNLIAAGFSIDNIAFGMGGGLLQAWNRDTLKYAMKASAIRINDGKWVGFAKDPITDKGKQSKEGRLALVHNCGIGSCSYKTIPEEVLKSGDKNLLRTVFKNGELLIEDTFQAIRERAALKEAEYVPETIERY